MKQNLIIYDNGELELKVSVEDDSVWLKTEDIAILFTVQRPAIVKHISNIYKTNELNEYSTCSILEQVAKDGKKRKIKYYNLDMIISIGYRVNTIYATQFRQWATSILKNYIINGYTINSNKITNDRFKELENDVTKLKNQVQNISNGLENDILTKKENIFYNSEVFDAYAFISDLLRKAHNNIILIDNYIDDSALTLFCKIPNIKVIIYTHTISKQLKLDLEKYNKQYSNISIKIFKNSHDRFLIIDKKELYHIGASLKDVGKKCFAVSKMDILFIDDMLHKIPN